MGKFIADWWPAVVAFAWLSFVQGVAGTLASVLCGIGMLFVCLAVFWEAGRIDRANPDHPVSQIGREE